MLTLHGYLARELLRTFVLTSVALTLLVVMGGGVANIFKGEGIDAEDLVKVFAFLTPVAITLILPVAALFSAAITYGRAAADNEITACRAAGINIRRLLLSAGLLGLFVTATTYASWNYLIPQLSRAIEDITRRDLPAIVVGQFQRAKPLVFGRYRIMANRCEILDPARIGPDQPAAHTYLLLSGVTFLEEEDEEIARYGTADATIIDFDHSGVVPRVAVDLQGMRTFDAARRQYYNLAHQILGPFDVPLPIRRKTKFENLQTLMEYRVHPEKNPEIEDRLYGLKRELMAYFLYSHVVERLRGEGSFKLTGPDVSYQVFSKEGGQDPDDGRPTLGLVRVQEVTPTGSLTYTADRATIELRSSADRTRPLVMVELLGNVEIRPETAVGSADGASSPTDMRVVRKQRESLKPIQYMDQPELARRIESVDAGSLLAEEPPAELPKRQTQQWERLLERLRKFDSEIRGEIHFRASYSLTSIAVVILGAALGIIVRGGQVLTAFGISCVPSLFVVLSSIVGRNLADRPDYSLASLSVMWGGTLLIYLASAFVTTKVLQR